MPRVPKTAPKSVTAAQEAVRAQKSKVNPAVQALQLFEEKMVESGNEIAAILSDLTIDFDNLRTQLSALGVGETDDTPEAPAPPPKPKTRSQAKAPVVEDDDVDEDDDDVEDDEDDAHAELDDDDEVDDDEDEPEEDDDDVDEVDDVDAELEEDDDDVDDDDDDDDWSAPPARPAAATRPKAQPAAPQRKKRPGTRR